MKGPKVTPTNMAYNSPWHRKCKLLKLVIKSSMVGPIPLWSIGHVHKIERHVKFPVNCRPRGYPQKWNLNTGEQKPPFSDNAMRDIAWWYPGWGPGHFQLLNQRGAEPWISHRITNYINYKSMPCRFSWLSYIVVEYEVCISNHKPPETIVNYLPMH